MKQKAEDHVRWVLEVIAALPATDFVAILPVNVRPLRR